MQVKGHEAGKEIAVLCMCPPFLSRRLEPGKHQWLLLHGILQSAVVCCRATVGEGTKNVPLSVVERNALNGYGVT